MAAVNAVTVLEYMRECAQEYSSKNGTPITTNVDLVEFLAIAFAENFGTKTEQDLRDDLKNEAGNTPPSTDRGMWMLNSYWWSHVTDECAFDWRCATRAVCEKTAGFKTSKTQWTAYKVGNYKTHLPICWVFMRLMLARDREKSAAQVATALADTLIQREAVITQLRQQLAEQVETSEGLVAEIATLRDLVTEAEKTTAEIRVAVANAEAALALTHVM